MNKKQRQTLAKIFENPERSDIRWDDIKSLLTALGAEISQGSESRIRVALGGVKAVFHRPHPKPFVNKTTVHSVRRFLLEVGVNNDGI
ncbi:MAG: type II toxin-antitoxin system HicA family toxin [Bacillota bacterium]